MLQYEVPRFMVDKVDEGGSGWRIWDTVEHTYTDDGEENGDPYRHKDSAIARAKELNGGD